MKAILALFIALSCFAAVQCNMGYRPWNTWCGGEMTTWHLAFDRVPVAGETSNAHLCVETWPGVTTPVTQITVSAQGLFNSEKLFSYTFQQKAIVNSYEPSCFDLSFPVPLNAPEDLLIHFDFDGYKNQGFVGCVETLVTVESH